MTEREKLIDLLDEVHHRHLGKEYRERLTTIADHLLSNGVTIQRWIPVTERLPEEHDSIFNLFHGTPRWTTEMFRTLSDIVLVVIVFENGSKAVKFARTEDGKWNIRNYYRAQEVTHWMPLPEPPKEETT